MVSKSILSDAKAYLCWDKFDDLSIQLIEIKESVAYFFPPNHDFKTILLFYDKDQIDFSSALFLLFHEAGHALQYHEYEKQNNTEEFLRLMNLNKGSEKVRFEMTSWQKGKQLFTEFLETYQIKNSALLSNYETYAQISVQTYAD